MSDNILCRTTGTLGSTTNSNDLTAAAESPSDSSELHQPQTQQPRSVTFSEYSQAILLPTEHEDDTETKYYSQEDIQQFQQTLISDVQRLQQELGSIPPEEIGNDNRVLMYECVGLETFLSRDMFQRTAQRMQSHMVGILEEQDRQQQNNIGSLDLEALAVRSEASSAWARGRAEELAAGYLRLRE